MPPRSAAAPSSCGQTDRQADDRSDNRPQPTDVGWGKEEGYEQKEKLRRRGVRKGHKLRDTWTHTRPGRAEEGGKRVSGLEEEG